MVIQCLQNVIIQKEKEGVQEGEYQQRVFPEQIADPLEMEVIHFSISFSLLSNTCSLTLYVRIKLHHFPFELFFALYVLETLSHGLALLIINISTVYDSAAFRIILQKKFLCADSN